VGSPDPAADAPLAPYGLAETCRVVGGGIPLWHYHRARLLRGGCPSELATRVEALALAEASRWADSPSKRVRLGVTIEPDGELSVVSGVHLSSLDVVNDPVAARVELADVATASQPAPPLPSGAAKPADRSWWDAAQRLAKRSGGHQAIIVGADGSIVDGGTATVWIAEDDRLVTPPSPPAVGGVARAFVLDAAARQGLSVAVEQFAWERFEAAEEAFLTNAFAGAVGVRGRGGTQYEAVRALFSAVWSAGR
jgi:branched-subunit amino acid aminotransferase/4-amino-4-deoxychorismate lyase